MDKPLSLFLANVVKNGAITQSRAEELNQLATPHLQFEAVMSLKRAPQISPCKDVLPVQKIKTTFMSNKRWIDVVALGLVIPLAHALWVRSPEIKKVGDVLSSHGVAVAQAEPVTLPAQPVIFVAAPTPERAFLPKHHPFHPKNELEALSHYMNEPVKISKPIDVEDPILEKSAQENDQAVANAKTAALEALPNTSRR